ncbi:MAG: hypothetical protein IJD00_02195, partial [Clostridia bacterium]|nr:hypothetical protein [Clostridia bacterium]
MKKLLAILCAVALVATCCAVSFTAFADESATATESPLLYNFTDKATTEKLISLGKIGVNNNNSALSYDETVGALKIQPKTIGGTNANQFAAFANNSTTNVTDYPVLAIKVKLNDPTKNFGAMFGGMNNNGSTSKFKTADLLKYDGFTWNASGDWQILIYDGTKTTDTYYKGQWYGMLFYFMGNNVGATESDYGWIEWVGTFKTVDDVYSYDGKTPSAFFYDFTSETETNNLISDGRVANNSGIAEIKYDTEKGALKVTAGTAESTFRINSNHTAAKVSKYPVFAMKVRFSDKNVNFGGIAPGCEDGNSLTSQFSNGYMCTDTVETGAYQLIVYDGTELSKATSTTYSGYWVGLLPKLAANQVCWIEWAGVFKTVADAYAQDADCASPFFYNFEDEEDVNALKNAGKLQTPNNSKLTISYENGALKLSTNTTGKSNNQFGVYPTVTTSATEYPVIAMKVKFTNQNAPQFGWINAGTNSRPTSVTGTWPSQLTYNYNDATFNNTASKDPNGDWQIIVWDGSQVAYNTATGKGNQYYCGNHAGVLFSMTDTTTAATVGVDNFYIQWAGAFKTVEDVYKATCEHTYDNLCDNTCNICGDTRVVGNHLYENACDANCNICDAARTVGDHVYDNACDADCNICKATRTPSDHVYDNACDADCNVCKAIRDVGDHNHQVDAEASSAATYFVAGKEVKVCEYCNDTVETPLPVAEDALIKDECKEEFANGNLTITLAYSEALIEDIQDGAVISFNYSIGNYSPENPIELDGTTGAVITLEGFNTDRLNAQLTYYLTAEYTGVNTDKLADDTTRTLTVANDVELDSKTSAFVDALNADGANTVVSAEDVDANTVYFAENTITADLKEGTMVLNFIASDELVAKLGENKAYDRTNKITVTIDGVANKYEFTQKVMRKSTTINISGMSFEQLNGTVTVKVEFIYNNA